MTTYPLADTTTQWWDDDWGWDIIKPNVLVLHTTEGLTWPTYAANGKAGAKAPHVTAKPDFANRRLAYRQHFHNEHSSRALQNQPGGVSTNTNNAWQIELIGTCDDRYKTQWTVGSKTYKAGVDYIHWPTAPDWALKSLADLVKYLHKTFPGLPIKSTVPFSAYDAGLVKDVRLSGAEWNNYYGILGHQHVPENYHGDPGQFPIQKLITFATEAPPVSNATKTTLSVYPTATHVGDEVSLTATVSPAAAAGNFVFYYTVDKKTWVRLTSVATNSKGQASLVTKPGVPQDYKAEFEPKDATKYGKSSGTGSVTTYDLADMSKRLDDALARIAKLEGGA